MVNLVEKLAKIGKFHHFPPCPPPHYEALKVRKRFCGHYLCQMACFVTNNSKLPELDELVTLLYQLNHCFTQLL